MGQAYLQLDNPVSAGMLSPGAAAESHLEGVRAEVVRLTRMVEEGRQ